MNEQFEKFIEKKSVELYPFAYALVPDDLQASQLVIDAIGLLQVDANISPKLTYYYQDSQRLSEDKVEITDILAAHIYRLAKRRTNQLNGTYIIPKGFGPFYQTPMNERAVLFLKEKKSYGFERISKVLGLEKVQMIQDYHLGVSSVHEFLGNPVEIN
jgi:hypothetical protein